MTASLWAGRQVTVSRPDAWPVSLAEAKAWLRVTLSEDDALLEALIRSASDLCEAYIGQLVLARTVSETLPIAMGAWACLAHDCVHSIDGVEGIPADGAPFPFPADAYQTEGADGARAWVRVLQPGAAGRMRVRYTAGIALIPDDVPDALRQGMLRMVAHLYAGRDDARDDGRDAAPPAAVRALWQPWRTMRL